MSREYPKTVPEPRDSIAMPEYDQEAPPSEDTGIGNPAQAVQEVLPGDGSFTVQVYALSDSLSAVQITESLKRSGCE